MIKQLQQHQQLQQNLVMTNSPKRNDLTPNHRQLLNQSIIQTFGVGTAAPAPQPQVQIQSQSPTPHHIIAQYQQQASLASNLQTQLQSTQLRQLSSSSVIPSQSPVAGSGRSLPTPVQCLQMSYYSQNASASQQPPYFGEVVLPLQVSFAKLI